MANSLPAVSICREIFLQQQNLSTETNLGEYSPIVANPFPAKKFCAHARKISDFSRRRVGFDRTASPVHNCAYVTPVEGKQARRRNAGYKDGAKIYFCNRRSCILTGERR